MLDPDAAFALGAEVKDARTLVFSWAIAEDHYKATDDYGVNPDTGDVMDPEGEIVDNLNNVKSK